MVNSKRHGRWVARTANGAVAEGEYLDGEWHGKWIFRNANGKVSETCYENGNEIDC